MHIVNSPRAARNTHRDRLPELMLRAGVPFPATQIVADGRPAARHAVPQVDDGLWLKRGDVHASVSADVQCVDSLDGVRGGRAEFASRGIDAAAVQEHRAGDEIKFYGVAGGEFFHWFYSGPSQRLRVRAVRAAAAGRARGGRRGSGHLRRRRHRVAVRRADPDRSE